MKLFKTKLTAAALGFALIGSTASAVTVYAEDFNRADSNTVGNGWSELSQANNDVRIRNNRLQLRDSRPGNPDAAVVSSVIDVTGLNTVMLSFDWRAMRRNEADDVLNVAWSANPASAITNPGQWTSLGQFSSGGTNLFSETLSLGAAASNQMFRLMFWTNVSDNSTGNREGFRIDNIVVTAVPVPAAGALLLAGMGGLGMARRRRRAEKP